MAKALYNVAKQAALEDGMKLNSNTIKAALIDVDDYTFSAAHAAYSTDVLAAAKVAELTLASITTTGGTFAAADGTWPSVTGDGSEAIIIYDSTLDRLIAYIDGIGVVPNGNNIDVNWDASGIFAF